jgi:hypothetical protein
MTKKDWTQLNLLALSSFPKSVVVGGCGGFGGMGKN